MRDCAPKRSVAMLLFASDTNPDTAALSKEVDVIFLGDNMSQMFTKGSFGSAQEKVCSYASAELG